MECLAPGEPAQDLTQPSLQPNTSETYLGHPSLHPPLSPTDIVHALPLHFLPPELPPLRVAGVQTHQGRSGYKGC